MMKRLQAMKALEKEQKMIFSTKKMKPIPLKTSKSIKINPGEHVWVPLVSNDFTVLSKTYIFETAPKFRNHDKIALYSVILENKIEIPVVNHSNDTFTLHEGSKLGYVLELGYEELPMLQELELCVADVENASKKASENTTEITRENLSPKEIAKQDFEEEMKKYSADQATFLRDYEDLFVPEHPYLLPEMKIHPISIKTMDPVIKPTPTVPNRKYSERDLEAIDSFIGTGLINGLLEKVTAENSSATLSPLHVVRKGNKARIVLDCRAVNELNIQTHAYVFPNIQEELAKLTKNDYSSYFCCDASGAFTQIPVADDGVSRNLFSFPVNTNRYNGVYRSKRLNFGLKSSPSIFASILDSCLEGLNSTSLDAVLCQFIDDMAGACNDHETQKAFLRIMFGRLRKLGVFLSIKKSMFFRSKVDFCGCEISKEGYKINEKRQKILLQYPDFLVQTKKKNAILSMLGFYNWHRNFVRDYANIDHSIRKIYKDYTENKIDAENANRLIKEFTDGLKNEIMSTMLISPSKNDICVLETDAAKSAWGYVCYVPKKGVISYGGGKFCATISSHNIYEKELCALSKSIKDTYRFLVQAKSCQIKNDNISAILGSNRTNTTPKMTPRVIKYLSEIQILTMDLDSSILWLNTKANLISDQISRLNYNENGDIVLDEKVNFNAVDFSEQELDQTALVESVYSMTKWSIYKLKKHFSLIGLNLTEDFIKNIIKNFTSQYRLRAVGPLSKLNARIIQATRPLESISIDFIDFKHSPSTAGHICVFTLRCEITKYTVAIPSFTFGTKNVIEILRNIQNTCGKKISSIYADNAFSNKIFNQFCEDSEILLSFRPVGQSRSVKCERVHKDLHLFVKKFRNKESDWHLALSSAIDSSNKQVHDGHGFVPYQLFHGQYCDVPGAENSIVANRMELVQKILNEKRENSNFKFRVLEQGLKVIVKYTNEKSNEGYEGQIESDEGGSSCIVRNLNTNRAFPVHKGNIYLDSNHPVFDH